MNDAEYNPESKNIRTRIKMSDEPIMRPIRLFSSLNLNTKHGNGFYLLFSGLLATGFWNSRAVTQQLAL